MSIEVIRYEKKYLENAYELWKQYSNEYSLKEMTPKEFDSFVFQNPFKASEYSFLLFDDGTAKGLIVGSVDESIQKSQSKGFLSLILTDFSYEKGIYADKLLDALESAFKDAGKSHVSCSFFGPLRFSWYMEEKFLHNNMPGVPMDSALHELLEKRDYVDEVHEIAMLLNLDQLKLPDNQRQYVRQMNKEGFSIDWYNEYKHFGLEDMVDKLGNEFWSREIPASAKEINMLVVTKNGQIKGFAGPVYREDSGRGFFQGIAIDESISHKGVATVLFHRLCLAEKACGAIYMSLFTNDGNHALKIYENVGFKRVKEFAVMQKVIL